MRYTIFLFLLLPAFLWGQYPNNPRKLRLGTQTTGAGLTYIQSGAPSHTPANDEDAWMVLDTTNNALYYYDEAAGAWENILDDVVRDTVFRITSVPDTSTIVPLQGDLFINATADTMGAYDGAAWQLFVGGGSSSVDHDTSAYFHRRLTFGTDYTLPSAVLDTADLISIYAGAQTGTSITITLPTLSDTAYDGKIIYVMGSGTENGDIMRITSPDSTDILVQGCGAGSVTGPDTITTSYRVLYQYIISNGRYYRTCQRPNVNSITSVPDTTNIDAHQGDMFINSTADTLGLYSGTGWVLFYGGGGGTQQLSIDSSGTSFTITLSDGGGAVTFEDSEGAGIATGFVSVGDYSGTDTEKFVSAFAASNQVLIPAGTYTIDSNFAFSERIHIVIEAGAVITTTAGVSGFWNEVDIGGGAIRRGLFMFLPGSNGSTFSNYGIVDLTGNEGTDARRNSVVLANEVSDITIDAGQIQDVWFGVALYNSSRITVKSVDAKNTTGSYANTYNAALAIRDCNNIYADNVKSYYYTEGVDFNDYNFAIQINHVDGKFLSEAAVEFGDCGQCRIERIDAYNCASALTLKFTDANNLRAFQSGIGGDSLTIRLNHDNTFGMINAVYDSLFDTTCGSGESYCIPIHGQQSGASYGSGLVLEDVNINCNNVDLYALADIGGVEYVNMSVFWDANTTFVDTNLITSAAYEMKIHADGYLATGDNLIYVDQEEEQLYENQDTGKGYFKKPHKLEITQITNRGTQTGTNAIEFNIPDFTYPFYITFPEHYVYSRYSGYQGNYMRWAPIIGIDVPWVAPNDGYIFIGENNNAIGQVFPSSTAVSSGQKFFRYDQQEDYIYGAGGWALMYQPEYTIDTTWTPADIDSKLAVWIEADMETAYVSGDTVSTATDFSSAGINFTGTGTSRPVFQDSILGNYPVFRFDGNDGLVASSNIVAGDGPREIYFVFTTSGGVSYFFSDGSSTNHVALGEEANRLRWATQAGGQSYTNNLVSGNTYLVEIRYPGNYIDYSSVYVDDTEASRYSDSGLKHIPTVTGNRADLGSRYGINKMTGDIAMLLVVDGILDREERANLKYYLSKYGY